MTNRKALAEQEVETIRAWRAIFLDDAGNLKPDSVRVLQDMERMCFQVATTAKVDSEGRIDPYQMALNEGKRAAFMSIKKRIFAPLEAYQRVIEKETSFD